MTNPGTAYRETDGRGATAVRLVVMLYEQAIQDLRQAAQAVEQNNVELRTNRINHALDVICLLQGTLNMERGGQVARNLARFYEALRAQLWEAQLHASQETLSQQITDLLSLREAWTEVDRAESAGAVRKLDPLSANAASADSGQQLSANWKA
jgi:flagellar secretion chaperone FliS